MHDSVVCDSVSLLQLHKLSLTSFCISLSLLLLLLVLKILVGLRDVVLPEVQEQAFLFATTVQVDAHATVVLSPEELRQALNKLGWSVHSSGRFFQVALISINP